MNDGRSQVSEEIRMLDMLLELIDTKLKSLFAERELMRRFYYSKEMDYEMTKEILEYQRLYHYVDERKAAIIAIASENEK